MTVNMYVTPYRLVSKCELNTIKSFEIYLNGSKYNNEHVMILTFFRILWKNLLK